MIQYRRQDMQLGQHDWGGGGGGGGGHSRVPYEGGCERYGTLNEQVFFLGGGGGGSHMRIFHGRKHVCLFLLLWLLQCVDKWPIRVC